MTKEEIKEWNIYRKDLSVLFIIIYFYYYILS